MIQTWIANVSALVEDTEKYSKYREKLPEWRKDKADQTRFAEAKAQSVGVWILWEKMREAYHLDKLAMYNLSHSGEYVMCSCSDRNHGTKIGCDIQKVGALKLNLAKRYFCEHEYQRIAACATPAEQKELFYRFWVLKESFAKATGQGLQIGLSNYEIEFDLNDVPYLKKQPEDITECFFYKEYQGSDLSYKMAVCSTDNDFSNGITEIIL